MTLVTQIEWLLALESHILRFGSSDYQRASVHDVLNAKFVYDVLNVVN